MPNISSPSHSPARSGGLSAPGLSAPYGIGGAYGGSPSSMYPSSPSYGASIGVSRPGAQQANGSTQANKPLATGATAYDPAMAGGDGKNSDSSDSDK